MGGEEKLFDNFRSFARQSEKVFAAEECQGVLDGLSNVQYLNASTTLQLPQKGQFMRLNASLALAAAANEGLSEEQGRKVLENFCGVQRRSQVHFETAFLTLFEDYAHHPKELKALNSA